jgi:type VI secretion system protein ImpG
MNEQQDLLRYYLDELSYLRQMGRSFAERYPKVAGRLELSPDACADPQVERMIESFAVLSARIRRQMDSEFPEITSSLLGVLYPHLVNPVPSMSIARFDVDPDQGKITTGYEIPKGSPLFAQTTTDLLCRFRTCYPVTLWPLEVVHAAIESPAQFDFLDTAGQVSAVLRIKLEVQGATLPELALTRLRFHIAGDASLTGRVYELLFGHLYRIAILPEGAKEPVYLPNSALSPVGFATEDGVIPDPSNSLPSYRLLQEFFVFREKFHFFDLGNLGSHQSNKTLDILILLNRLPRKRLAIDRNTFVLGCTPIVNLYSRTTEPVRLDHRNHEYRLVADMRREQTTEIHSILSVSASSNALEPTIPVEPFYSFRHRSGAREQKAFWHTRRVPASRADMPGTDLLISFLDLDFNPHLPPNQTLYAHTLCTNRYLATQLPAGARLQIEDAAPLSMISCLSQPTAPFYPPLGGATVWKLISNLSLNYLSLTDDSAGLAGLRELLRLYSFSDQPSSDQQVQGITAMNCKRVVRHVGDEAWRGFCQGTEVNLTFDESLYPAGDAFLFGAVLNQFLALYASVNSFTQLVIRSEQREGEWKRWPPVAGFQTLV